MLVYMWKCVCFQGANILLRGSHQSWINLYFALSSEMNLTKNSRVKCHVFSNANVQENFEDQCKMFVQLCLLLRLFSISRGECERSSPTAKLRGSVNTDKSVPTGDN